LQKAYSCFLLELFFAQGNTFSAVFGVQQPLFISAMASSLKMSEMDAMGQAYVVRACGEKAVVDSVMAEIAFLGDSFFRVEVDGPIGAFVDTAPAPGALRVIHDDDAVFPSCDRLFGTNRCTGGGLAVTAHVDAKDKLQLFTRKPGAVFENPDELYIVGRLHFLLACHLAGFAPPAGFIVDDNREAFHA
jgi:predicted secreted protein